MVFTPQKTIPTGMDIFLSSRLGEAGIEAERRQVHGGFCPALTNCVIPGAMVRSMLFRLRREVMSAS
jgi:hypothetical protein